jgi:ABC-type multidrug transport system fused ATPase/permease subunit
LHQYKTKSIDNLNRESFNDRWFPEHAVGLRLRPQHQEDQENEEDQEDPQVEPPQLIRYVTSGRGATLRPLITMTQFKVLYLLVRRFLPFLHGVRSRWVQAAILMALAPALSACLLLAVKVLIDDVFVGQAFDRLPFLISIYVAIALAKLAIGYLSARVDVAVTEQVAQNVRVALYRHAMSLSPGTMTRYSTGDLLTRLSGDADRVEILIYSGLLGLGANFFSVLVFAGVLLMLSWKLTLCTLLVAPLLALVSMKSSPAIRRASRIARRYSAAWTTLAEERLGAVAMVQASGAEQFETAAFERRCAAARKAEIKASVTQAWSAALIEAVAVFGGLAVILLGAMEIYSGNLTVGTLIAFLGSVGSLYGPIGSLAKAPGRFQRAAARVQRVSDLLDTKSDIAERPHARPLPKSKGELEFRGVSFGYAPNQKVLDGIDLRIEAGETVAIVGPSGSGKSSLMKLALRLYDPWTGSVRIDGHDLTIPSMRQAMAVVMQEPHLFRGSIADNIRYERIAADAELAEAGRAAHVADIAAALPGGYDSPVGPAGAWLSGGQRQRIGLARALLRDAPIMLLDEATGAVDSETEELIQDALDRLSGRRTMLIVGHRFSSVRRADRIVVIENGRIVETGSPTLLLATNSRCRELFAAQLVTKELAA